MTLLDVQDLRVAIGSSAAAAEVLCGLSFSLAAGECLGIVGESGCGKSMTALALMGLLPDGARAEGQIRLGGRDLVTAREPDLCRVRGRRVAMIFQEPMTALNPVKTIGAQVAEGPRLHLGLGPAEALTHARGLLDRVGLPPDQFSLDLYPHQLSGGQRQRAMIAMALACGPEILIADEPTTALDVTIQSQILDLLAEVVAVEGMALIMISHDLGLIAEMTDRVLVMYSGRIVESGPTARVFDHRAHPYTEGLFAALPAMNLGAGDGRSRLATIPGQVPDPLHRPAGCAFVDRCPRASAACHEAPPWRGVAERHRTLCFHPNPGEAP